MKRSWSHLLDEQTRSRMYDALHRADGDSARPIAHFRAPANFMSDIHGVIYNPDDEHYHIFYQFNPWDDVWNFGICWGHARSPDLVHWQHLPIALRPNPLHNIGSCFSGSSYRRKDGRVVLVYTALGAEDELPLRLILSRQILALSKDPGLTEWEDPIPLPTQFALHPDILVSDWRDPFLCDVEGHTYMLLGGNLNHRKIPLPQSFLSRHHVNPAWDITRGHAVIMHYRALNDSLTQWQSCGVLYEHPDPAALNVEMPMFLKVDGVWALVHCLEYAEPQKRTFYHLGNLQLNPDLTLGYKPQTSEYLDHGSLYASSVFRDRSDQRWLLSGWIRGFGGGRGWAGCMSLPRELRVQKGCAVADCNSIACQSLRLTQNIAAEVKMSRCTEVAVYQEGNRWISAACEDTLELECSAQTIVPGGTLEAELAIVSSRKPGCAILRLRILAGDLHVEPMSSAEACKIIGHADQIQLRVFLDRSVVDVFINQGRQCLTGVLDLDPARTLSDQDWRDCRVEFSAAGSRCALSVWGISSAWPSK